MKKLTAMEWAKAKEPITHLSIASRSPGYRENISAWLAARGSDGWFYTTGDNYHFGSTLDATAFRQWVASQ